MPQLEPAKPWYIRPATYVLAGFGVALFGAGFVAASMRATRNAGTPIKQIRLAGSPGWKNEDYAYINPLLGCEVANPNELVDLLPIKNKLLSILEEKKGKGMIENASVYFDMRDGRWFSIGSDSTYDPASLLKVPVMIAVLKQAETDPELLKRTVTYYGNNEENNNQMYKPAQMLERQHAYTIEDLVERMITYSDNAAMNLLIRQIGETAIERVYADYNVHLSVKKTGDAAADTIQVKEYANFFRTLYNASYLNSVMSEKALSYLAKSDFTSGIVAGVPAGTQVAHKFGEFTQINPSGSTMAELHDCGVVYAERSYLLCVMTRGDNYKKLESVLKDVSESVYGSVNK